MSFPELFTYPITEWDDPATLDIDLAPPAEVSRLIFDNEKQIFGSERSSGVYTAETILACVAAARAIRRAIEDSGGEPPRIVLAGAGTSGRLCYFISTYLRREFRGRAVLVPLIAGTAKSLTRARTGAEDDFEAGARDFQTHVPIRARRTTIAIGVSCALSSAYVAGVLQEALTTSTHPSVLVGFASDRDATSDVRSLFVSSNLILVNPNIGPEPISGSVRMKGGTATIILLDAILSAALVPQKIRPADMRRRLRTRQHALEALREYKAELGQLIDFAGSTLRKGGAIHLLGREILGRLCVYDTAECYTTFGASKHQVNAYTGGGPRDLAFYRGDLRRLRARVRTFRAFSKRFEPDADAAFFLSEQTTTSGPHLMSRFPMHVVHFSSLGHVSEPQQHDSSPHRWLFEIPSKDVLNLYLAARVTLVHISTGAFIQYGRILRNRMIGLRITSRKLLRRAVRLIGEYSRLPPEDAFALLRTVLHGVRRGDQRQDALVKIAATVDHVIPRALLAALYPDLSQAEIDAWFREEPVLRRLVLRLINSSAQSDVADG